MSMAIITFQPEFHIYEYKRNYSSGQEKLIQLKNFIRSITLTSVKQGLYMRMLRLNT